MSETESPELAKARAERDVLQAEALKAYEARKAKARTHLEEAVADAQRALRRALKESGDPDRLEAHLKAARLGLRAAEDAARRLAHP